MRHCRQLVLNGRKWWITGAGHPHCKICIFMGRVAEADDSTPRHQRHSMVLVPMDTAGLTVVRPLRALICTPCVGLARL